MINLGGADTKDAKVAKPIKLSKAQFELLKKVGRNTSANGEGLLIWKSQEMRAANNLQRAGLLVISIMRYARITEAGRSALPLDESDLSA